MNSATITIRAAKRPEFDTIANVWHESASEDGVGPPTMPTINELRRRIDIEMQAGWQLFVAVIDHEIVGMLALKPEQQVLDQLFVRPAHIGDGLGYKLFLRAQTELPHGFSLHTASSNDRGRRFYERAGMHFVREAPHPRTSHPVAYYMWQPA